MQAQIGELLSAGWLWYMYVLHNTATLEYSLVDEAAVAVSGCCSAGLVCPGSLLVCQRLLVCLAFVGSRRCTISVLVVALSLFKLYKNLSCS